LPLIEVAKYAATAAIWQLENNTRNTPAPAAG